MTEIAPPDRTGPPRTLVEGRSTAIRTVAVRCYSIAATFALSVVVTRTLGVGDAGAFFLVFTVTTLLATLGRWGTDTLALKVVAAGQERAARVAWQLLGAAAVISTLVAAAAVAGLPVLLDTVTKVDVPHAAVRLGAVAIVPAAASIVASAILRGRGRIASGTFAELGSTPTLTVAALLGLGAWVSSDLTRTFAVLLAASLVTATWAVVACAVALPRSTSGAADDLPVATMLRTNAPALWSMCGTAVLFFALTWAPVLVLSTVAGSDQVAYYTVAARLAAFVTLIPAIQSSYLAPSFAALFHDRDLATLNALARRATVQAVALGGLVTLAIVVAPRTFLAIFGQDFDAASAAVRVLTISALLVAAFGQVPVLMLNVGLEHRSVLLAFVVLMVGSGVMLALGGSSGAVGVAWANCVALVAFAAGGSAVLNSRLGIVSGVVRLGRTNHDRQDEPSPRTGNA